MTWDTSSLGRDFPEEALPLDVMVQVTTPPSVQSTYILYMHIYTSDAFLRCMLRTDTRFCFVFGEIGGIHLCTPRNHPESTPHQNNQGFDTFLARLLPENHISSAEAHRGYSVHLFPCRNYKRTQPKPAIQSVPVANIASQAVKPPRR